MALNPLDLQVNFSQLNQVGKQQTLAKDSEVIRQDQLSEQVKKEGDKIVEDVPETRDLDEGPGKIKDEEKKKNLSNKNKEKKDDKDDKDDKNKKNEMTEEKSKFKDPDLGQKIDIIG